MIVALNCSMYISETVKETDYLMLGSNLDVESVIG